MKRNLSIYIIFVPIIFVLISITTLTVYNINEINKNGQKQIDEYKNEYLINEKTKIYNRIHYFANIIKHKTNEYNSIKNEEIKLKADELVSFGKNLFNKNNNYSKEDIKKIFISRTESLNSKNNNNYYSLIDIKTNKVILNNQKKLLNLDVSKFVDLDGRQIILMENVYDKFLKLKLTKSDNDEKRYNKIIYIKKLEELDLAVIYGEYIDDINLEIQNKILSDVLYYDFENNPYIFIIKIFDFNRDSNYGEVILHHAKPELVGKKLSLNNSDRRVDDYRRDYIQKLKNYGEGFVTYYYSRPDSNKISQKMSYFYLQKDWNWALGAGFYFDDLDESIKDFRIKIKLQTKDNVNAAIILSIFLTILISIILFFISNRINKIIGDYSQNLKDSNEQLKKQKDIFETLFEKSSDGILIYNENGDIINCNDSLVRIFGYEDKEFLLGKNYLEFSPKLQFKDELSNKKAKLINKICFDNKLYSFDWLFQTKVRKSIYCEVTATIIDLDGDLVIHSVIRDVTEKKELEEKTKRQQVMLAEESKKSAMGEMITMIAHQWRQPLNNVNLLIHFVRDNFDRDNITKDDLKSIANDMRTQIEYMSKTIDDFTNFINPRREISIFDLKTAFEKTFNIIKGQFTKNNIKIIENIENIEVKGIENEFMQVLLNILNNAKDSLDNIQKDKLIFVNGKVVNNKVIFTIKDNAGGIPKKVLSRIFEPYFTTKHKKNGTGIGLYMSEEIIKQYKNGSILASNEHYYYENKFYEGAMFTITFDLD